VESDNAISLFKDHYWKERNRLLTQNQTNQTEQPTQNQHTTVYSKLGSNFSVVIQ